MLPSLLPADRVRSANGLTQVTESLARFVTPPLAGLLVTGAGALRSVRRPGLVLGLAGVSEGGLLVVAAFGLNPVAHALAGAVGDGLGPRAVVALGGAVLAVRCGLAASSKAVRSATLA